MDTFSFIPGRKTASPGSLARFLPPLEDGVISTWLSENVKKGAWVLDPFGSSPRLALEAARTGYRVLVTVNNPVTRFLLEICATAPKTTEFKAALADLAVSRRGNEKLETHLQTLYHTPCSNCQKEVPARAFLWRKGENAPYARIYECKECHETGEKPVTPFDIERAANIARMSGLHRARVLERVAELHDPDRGYAEDAIQHYLPRAVYVLATLINRLDGMQVSPERRRALTGLLLSACDRGSTLWPYPAGRPRPKQLSTPPQFQEYNIWQAIEESIGEWDDLGAPLPCLHWSQKGRKLPESGGLLIYDGRIKDLAEAIRDVPVEAVISAIPRPNQAFWTLSALWAGWLWGREAVGQFKVALRRRRYDWNWQAGALYAAFQHVFDLLPLSAPFFGLLAEAEPSFLAATSIAANGAGFDLQGLAMRTAHDPVQILWRRGERLSRSTEDVDLLSIRKGLYAHLQALGEPASFFQLFAAGLVTQIQSSQLLRSESDLDNVLQGVQSGIRDSIKNDSQLERIDSSDRSLEVGLWDLKNNESREESLADRVEKSVVNFVMNNPAPTLLEIEHTLYKEFPGLLTPSRALVSAVLESYTVQKAGRWYLRDEDQPVSRRAELQKMAGLIDALGKRLAYKTETIAENAYAWLDGGSPARIFYLIESAMVGHVLAENRHPAEKCSLVIPGGRAGLLSYKKKRDPRLEKSLEGWQIVKFRLMRSLEEIPVLDRVSFEEQITSDPIEQSPGQMMMF